jgi:hypothetical protein
MGKNYWMMVASPEEYEITKDHGFTVYGVRSKYRRRAQRMQPDDRILFYVTGLRKWTATATITSAFFEDRTPIWNVNGRTEVYPFRVKTKPEIILREDDYIDALLLAPRLDYLKRWAPEDWPLAFFESLHLLPQKDFRLIEAEMDRFVAPSRNNRRRPPVNGNSNVRKRNNGQRWEQDRRRPNSSNKDWKNGPNIQTPVEPIEQETSQPKDKLEAIPNVSPFNQGARVVSLSEQQIGTSEVASYKPAEEQHHERIAGYSNPPMPNATHSDGAGATQDSVSDAGQEDQPATDDSSTDSSST